MPDEETLDRRLRAVERTLADGDHDVEALRDAGDRAERIQSLEAALAEAEDRITELEAATQALRGYVGNVRSVNEDVERRASAALATVERLEARLDDGSHSLAGDGRHSARTERPDARERPETTDRRQPVDRDVSDGRAAAADTGGFGGADGGDAVTRGGPAATSGRQQPGTDSGWNWGGDERRDGDESWDVVQSRDGDEERRRDREESRDRAADDGSSDGLVSRVRRVL